MKQRLISFLLVLLLAGYSHSGFGQVAAPIKAAQTKDALPRSTPEKEGVSSPDIIRFLEAANQSTHEFHSLMILRHGKVITEGWWAPYRAGLNHSLYSVTKSFVSTAVGLAVGEGRLKVTDKVISFFPHELPDTVSDYLKQLTIKNLLTMSMGQDPDPTPQVTAQDDWVKASLAAPIVHAPGTKFVYNNIGPNLLSSIIQKITGQKLIDYLRPRLFVPLGIRGIDWETDPKGINTGGWGLRVKTEDMAKLGQLYLQKGNWNGHQILSREWVAEATGSRIIQEPGISQAKRDSSDWQQGYGYLFWQCRHEGFRGDGAFGQFIVALPKQDAVIVITCETPDMQPELDLVWKYLLPAFHQGILPADGKAVAALHGKLSSLALPLPGKNQGTNIEKDISGKTFTLQANDMQLQSMTFQFANGVSRLLLKTDTAQYDLVFSLNKWSLGETTRHGPYLASHAKNNLTGLPAFKIAGAYRWKEKNVLELTLRYLETPHTQRFVCRFDDKNNLVVNVSNSLFMSDVLQVKGSSN